MYDLQFHMSQIRCRCQGLGLFKLFFLCIRVHQWQFLLEEDVRMPRNNRLAIVKSLLSLKFLGDQTCFWKVLKRPCSLNFLQSKCSFEVFVYHQNFVFRSRRKNVFGWVSSTRMILSYAFRTSLRIKSYLPVVWPTLDY